MYIDRGYVFTEVPDALKGLEFIRTANNDKDAQASDFLSFTLTQEAIVYVLYDMRSMAPPDWISDGGWELIGSYVVTDDIIRQVYQKKFPPGKVTLEGNAQPPITTAYSNYNVVARPVDQISSPHVSAQSSAGIELAVNHVIFNESMLGQYVRGGELGQFVRPYDSFMLVSGNNYGNINTKLLNSWAATLRKEYPRPTIYAATSGIDNVRDGAAGLDRDLFTGFMMVYEPNQENAPEFSWDMAQTKLIWEEAADIIALSGLEPWGKPSGRSLPGGPYFGDWDYGELASIMSGLNVQTQGRCRLHELNDALFHLVGKYRSISTDSDLFIQVTIGPDQINHADPEDAITCARSGWAYPDVDAVTMWWSPHSVGHAKKFLELREGLLPD